MLNFVNSTMATDNQTYLDNRTMNNTNQSQLNQTILEYEYGYEYEYDLVLDPEQVLSRQVFIVVLPFIIVFGTFGNLLPFYVMRTESLKDVSLCFYISILGLVDAGKFPYFTPVSASQYLAWLILVSSLISHLFLHLNIWLG